MSFKQKPYISGNPVLWFEPGTVGFTYDIQIGKRRNHSALLSFTNSRIGHILTSHQKVGQSVCKNSLFTAEVSESAAADQVGRYLIVLRAEACFSWLVGAVYDLRPLPADQYVA
jgi:hypothetical protein